MKLAKKESIEQRRVLVRTKIIATLGPSSNTETTLRKMFLAGLDVVRLNFSHSQHKEHLSRLNIVRTLNKKLRRHIKVLQDLEGYRIRIGRLKNNQPLILKKKQKIWLAQQPTTESDNVIPFDYEGNIGVIKESFHIYIDDGNIELIVREVKKDKLLACVETEGILKSFKGINIPQAKFTFPGLSNKDKNDIEWAIRHKVDYIAQSFVRNKKDIQEIRGFIDHRLKDCQIIAKIENREGINNIDEILEVSDGIMIARGDMGVSVPIYEIPMIQKEIIKKCNQKKEFVITATQMLESMTENRRPTRAEVTDVANAILDGTDFVMLSAETAIGKYPVETVCMMNDIIRFTESSLTKTLISCP